MNIEQELDGMIESGLVNEASVVSYEGGMIIDRDAYEDSPLCGEFEEHTVMDGERVYISYEPFDDEADAYEAMEYHEMYTGQ